MVGTRTTTIATMQLYNALNLSAEQKLKQPYRKSDAISGTAYTMEDAVKTIATAPHASIRTHTSTPIPTLKVERPW